ncbi:Peptidoglycan/LPS O-acetylase OafA/YrhL, contains acyltransferase and SGNH-hydrolase domains [Primorskyibacter flagellatus]|uniref:Peptidoglycan/LPS O-acetylase OafA/YrhL, contains acyltransferase and SGNH-hydrolase domains n=1 Tax=Primorskyibacter flagellatus TaxID=1387277 RepID=A0A1W2DZL4_9RHOB|nr:Peptidoglycan/LPS O-acetylase OafA/YrhL, contains acyltransferase and SGNH-hydrolase domains [Primorskyibacter flagellatus]
MAVLPVVLYHFGMPGLSGGFVGVDIFFVISGFLIGGILWAELNRTGRVRLGAFFLRRVRRLAPAYLAMAAITLACAWFILLPFDFREFGQELVAATVYLANVHYFDSAGYFDQASDQKLLLHTWSLAVEEQFYIVLPLLLIVLARWRAHLPAVLVGLGVLSLSACLWMMTVSPPAAFYLFPFRAWELLAGVCLAITGYQRGLSWQVHPALSWVGIALIAVAVFLFEAGDHFPGFYALVPVLGATLIIANGRDKNIINRALCSRPALFFGLISYSLYLWHWPIVTLLRYYQGEHDLAAWQILLMLAAAVVVSWISWRVVETPFRRGVLPGWQLVAGYVTAAMMLAGGALSFAFSEGLPGRFTPESHPYIAATRDFNQDWSRCTQPVTGVWGGIEICPIGPAGPPKVLIWGDSHARAFKEGIERAAFEANQPGLLIWRPGCPPLIGVLKDELVSSPSEEAACASSVEVVLQGLAATASIQTVLLVGRWSYYAEGTGIGADDRNRIELKPDPAGPLTVRDRQKDLFADALALTVTRLSQLAKQIFVQQQPPEIFDYTARKAAQALAYGQIDPDVLRNGLGTTTREALRVRFAGADAALARVTNVPGVRVIDLWTRMCSQTACSAIFNATPIYFDNNHVTNAGALALRDLYAPVFEGG